MRGLAGSCAFGVKVYRKFWLSQLSPQVSFGFLTPNDLQGIEDSSGVFNFLRAHFRVFSNSMSSGSMC